MSVVLPTYNEADAIVALIRAVSQSLADDGRSFEVLLVDDDSPDGTGDRARAAFANDERIVVLTRSGARIQRGLALSIRDGLANARGDVLVVMDADFNHDPGDLPRLLDAMSEADLVSGSRFVPTGGMYSATRLLGSRWMNAVARIALRSPHTDQLAGFFAIRRETLASLPRDRIFRGYGDYFIRLLYYASRQGARIVEIPVVYPPRRAGESKTPLVRTTLRYLWEIARLATLG